MNAAITRVAAVLGRKPPGVGVDNFDSTFKTETATIVPLWRLRIPSSNAKFGIRYQTSSPSAFLDALGKVPEDLHNLVFIDLGCGKGRTLILAAKQGFKRVMGVEFSPQLAAIARENVRRVGVTAEVLEMDACHFNPPDDSLLVYMYNPFKDIVVDAVLRNLRQWAQQSYSKAFVIYVNPACRNRFDSAPEFEVVVDQDGMCIWRLQGLRGAGFDDSQSKGMSG